MINHLHDFQFMSISILRRWFRSRSSLVVDVYLSSTFDFMFEIVEITVLICTFGLHWLISALTATSHALLHRVTLIFLHRTLAFIPAFHKWQAVKFVVINFLIICRPCSPLSKPLFSHQFTSSQSFLFPVLWKLRTSETILSYITLLVVLVTSETYKSYIACFASVIVLISSAYRRVGPFPRSNVNLSPSLFTPFYLLI